MIDGLTNWDYGGRVANPDYLGVAWQMPNSELEIYHEKRKHNF